MADPIVIKISELTELAALATGDWLQVVDISESLVANKTKKIQAGSLKVFTDAQLENSVVIATKIATDAVETLKIKDAAVTATKIAANAVETLKIKDAAVTLAKLAPETTDLINRGLVYMQLFNPSDLIVTTTAKEYVFITAYMAGKRIKRIGLGVKTAGTGNTTVAFGSYASIAGNGYTEADLNVALPAAGTKVPINVTAGAGSPKGLDFWFEIG